ncbi:hypothetical protein [Polyangium jinanense]|uniref:Lipoprotein n=1 Tax=Polyangium jinanense TaxID=2829994 RepID=A0A9X4AY62_9BACT|nr:hypothetical protein [Polyangium jinanense]MDC3958675.1 hypothetical protein [Polyangium jinanense]MDC3988461.1 hypothetical protein [Polyangium jinanense]
MASRVHHAALLLMLFGTLAGCGDVAPEEDSDVEISVEEVTERRGSTRKNLVVSEGEFSAEATTKPWSSWWFPTAEDFLFAEKNGELSPLQKYDLYNSTFQRKTTKAAAYERDKLYDARADTWSGLCFAWALASIMEPEPNKPMVHGSLRFKVGDLKALLLKTYEAVTDTPTIGDRNDGEWDDVYADILPHTFHRVLVVELFKNRRPFIIDRDAGHEVWNLPVYKAITKITRDARARDVVHVRTVLFVSTPDVKTYDYVGMDVTTREYTYDLHGAWEGRRFIVRGGAWTENSRADHPDFVVLRPNKVERASFNPEIDVETVDAILGRGR